jgi:hypothetical protein
MSSRFTDPRSALMLGTVNKNSSVNHGPVGEHRAVTLVGNSTSIDTAYLLETP